MNRPEWPGNFLLLACASLAFGPRFVLPVIAPTVAAAWWEPLQHATLLLALLANLRVFGRQAGLTPWPVLVTTVMLALVPLAYSGPGQPLLVRAGHAVAAWIVLSLPWLLTAVRVRPGSEPAFARGLASIAALSAAAGLILHSSTQWAAFVTRWGLLYRFRGATRGDYFAALAFAGVVIAVHEWNRRRGRLIGVLATLNAVLLILSASRTALVALVVWITTYAVLSSSIRAKLSPRHSRFWVALVPVATALLLYLPVLRSRMSGLGEGEIDLSGRVPIWQSLLEHFQSRPWFGLGLGAAQPGVLNVALPHDEMLRLLVEGGIVGTVLFLAAVVFWACGVRSRLGSEDRPFLAAFLIALAVYSLTDNPISGCYILPFVYLGTLLGDRETDRRTFATG